MEERIESIGENEKINICVIKLQAEIRYYLQSIALNRKTKNMECIKILQKNIRHWQKNYEDAWYQMYGHIRPRLKRTKMREMIEKMQKQMVLLEEKMMKENDEYDSFQQKISEIESEKQKLMDQLEMVKSGATTVEERLSAAKNANNELQKMLNDANNLLTKQENETSEVIGIYFLFM
ncbi:unnamed protein product [Thelazia callipaeda]|uniref:Uncharacterized protein n=1 Tax=Thelazia callipaeda TaxID=103827 RepID=A0A0N5DB34_THECL|nr:unnamed protein product [Thelazia callipaeda]